VRNRCFDLILKYPQSLYLVSRLPAAVAVCGMKLRVFK